jgi:N-methylhydantoinase B
MRSYISEMPNGSYFVDYLDNDGIVDSPLKIHLTLTIKDDMLFDFKGLATGRGYTHLSRYTTMLQRTLNIYPEIPVNGGCFRPIRFNILTILAFLFNCLLRSVAI